MALHNPLLDKLRAGETVGCHWLLLGSPAVAELFADAKPDAIVFDLQHGLWDRSSLESAIGLVAPLSTPIVRTAENSPHAISTALDAGALGILVPLIETAEQAAAAVSAAKFPPAGLRSGGGVRPLKDFIGYGKAANDAILVGVMIETKKGVDNAAKIAKVPGVDLVFIGTGDLAFSLGTFPEFDDRHEAAIEKIDAACRAAGVPCGVFTPFVTFALDRRRQGYQWVVLGSDVEIVHGAAKMTASRFALKPPADKKAKSAAQGRGRARHRHQPRHRARDRQEAARRRRRARLLRRARSRRDKAPGRARAQEADPDRARRHRRGPDSRGGQALQGHHAAGQQCRRQFQHAAVRHRRHGQCAQGDRDQLFRHARHVPRLRARAEAQWRRRHRQHAVDPRQHEPAAHGLAVRLQGGRAVDDPGAARRARRAGHARHVGAAGCRRDRHDP